MQTKEPSTITVADMLALPAIRRSELVAPVEGAAARPVRNFAILDHAPGSDSYESYGPGDFVVTNVGFAYDDPALTDEALLAMIDRSPAAIAVKTVYVSQASARVCDASVAAGVPVFLYEGEYHEIVAYQALDLMRRDAEECDKERAVDALLAGHDSRATRASLFELAGVTGSSMQCFAVAPYGEDDCSLFATLDALTAILDAFKRDWSSVEAVFVCCYRGFLLTFVSYSTLATSVRSASEADLVARIEALGRIRIGVGEEAPLEDGDISVHEAMAALKTAQNEDQDIVCWADLHHDAFRAAAAAGRLFARTSALHRALLEEHDAANGTELAATADAVARAYGDVRLAAELLHQHPNTVRYRLRKAKAALGMPDSPDREFVFLLGLVYMQR